MGAATPSPLRSATTTAPSVDWNVAEPTAGPTVTGENCTSTEHDDDGASAMPEQASATSVNTPGTWTVIEPTRSVDDVELVSVTGAVRRPASTTVGPKSTGDANALSSTSKSGTNGRNVVDDDCPDVEGTTTRGNDVPVSGKRVTTTDAGSVVAGTVVGLVAPVVVDVVEVEVVVVGAVGTVVVVVVVDVVEVVVVSPTPVADDRRSIAHTDGAPPVADGAANDPPTSSAAVARISQRPYCEIDRRPTGSAAASSAIGSSVVPAGPDDTTRTAAPRRYTTWFPSPETVGREASSRRICIWPAVRSTPTTNGVVGAVPATTARSSEVDSKTTKVPSAEMVGDVEPDPPGPSAALAESSSTADVALDHRYTLADSGVYGVPPGPATNTTVVPAADTSTSTPVTIPDAGGVAPGSGAKASVRS